MGRDCGKQTDTNTVNELSQMWANSQQLINWIVNLLHGYWYPVSEWRGHGWYGLLANDLVYDINNAVVIKITVIQLNLWVTIKLTVRANDLNMIYCRDHFEGKLLN